MAKQTKGSTHSPTQGGTETSRRLDALGTTALLSYLLVGGLLVFGFALAIFPAVEAQNAAACKPLRPEARPGPAPEFVVQDLEGNEVRLSDFRGKFVVINFWATFCEPCITEWPQVERLAERVADREDIVVLAISIDPERDPIEPFLEQMALTDTEVQVLWDPTESVHNAFGTTNIPDTYFVDEEGQIVHAFVNVRDWGSPDAYHCLDSVAG